MPNEIIPQRNSCFLLSLSFSCTFLSFFPALSFLLLFWLCTRPLLIFVYTLMQSDFHGATPFTHFFFFCSFFFRLGGMLPLQKSHSLLLSPRVCHLARVSERPLTCTPERLGQVSVLHKDLKAKDTDSRVLTLVNQVGVSRHFSGIDTDGVKETGARALIGS